MAGRQIRRGTAAELVTLGNLAAGEFGLETDTRRVLIGSSMGNQVIKGDYITPEMYGGGPAKSAAINSAAIQAAINAQVSLGSREVVIRKGVYQLAHQGADPNIAGYNHCLNIPSGARIILEWGAVLNLAASQSTDAAPVNMLTLGDVSNVYLGGEGTITQNCANQPGWTGGYAQQVGGALIMQNKTVAISGLTIEGLILDGCFGTAFDLRGGDDTKRLSDVFLRFLTVKNVGEGILVCWAKRVTVEHCKASDDDDVQIGDGIEMAGVDGFYLHNNTFYNATNRTHGGGTAYDIYGSKNGIIDGFQIDRWSVASGGGIDIARAAAYTTPNPKNIIIKNGIVKNCPGTGLIIRGGYAEYIDLSDIILEENGQYGIQCGTDNIPIPGPVTLTNIACRGNVGNGAYFKSTKNLTVKSSQFIGNTVAGLVYDPRVGCAAADELTGVVFEGLVVRDNTTYGISIGDAVGGFSVAVVMNDIHNEGNGINFRLPAAVASRDLIRITNVGPPKALGVTDGFAVSEATYVNITGNLTTLTKGTCGQILTMRFWGSYTVTHSIVTDGFDLQGAANFVGVDGNTLTACWMTGQWREIGRKV